MKTLKVIFSADLLGTWIIALFTCGIIFGVVLTHQAMTLDRDAKLASMREMYDEVVPPATPVYIDGISFPPEPLTMPFAELFAENAGCTLPPVVTHGVGCDDPHHE